MRLLREANSSTPSTRGARCCIGADSGSLELQRPDSVSCSMAIRYCARISNARTYGGYRTGGLWVATGISFGAVAVGSGLALLGMFEFDERCMQGMTQGPGRLLRVRDQAFPPATICEFQHGDVSSIGGRGVLSVLLWGSLLVMVTCLLVALIAECFDPRLGSDLVGCTDVQGREAPPHGDGVFRDRVCVPHVLRAGRMEAVRGAVVGLLSRSGLGNQCAEDVGVQLLPTSGDLSVHQRLDAADEPGLDGVTGNGVGRSRADSRSRLCPCPPALGTGTAGGAARRCPGDLRHR